MEETEKMFRTGFVDYGISLDAFVEQEKMEDSWIVKINRLKGRRFNE